MTENPALQEADQILNDALKRVSKDLEETHRLVFYLQAQYGLTHDQGHRVVDYTNEQVIKMAADKGEDPQEFGRKLPENVAWVLIGVSLCNVLHEDADK